MEGMVSDGCGWWKSGRRRPQGLQRHSADDGPLARRDRQERRCRWRRGHRSVR
jgi:hypothetical protein